MRNLSTLVIPFLIAALLAPLLEHLAARMGWMDRPGTAKIHGKPVPRIGGVAIAVAIIIPGIYFRMPLPYIAVIFLAALLGFADDLGDISPMTKLAGQIAIASFLFYLGASLAFLPFLLSLLISVTWLVGISNAVNLIDGLDGLAAGTTAISAVSFASIAHIAGLQSTAYFCLIVAAAMLGFLIHNFHPASIFMGDSGSLPMGFVLGIIALHLSNVVGPAVPLIVLALPIFDTFYAIARRALGGKPIFGADLGHFYNSLMDRVGHLRAVLICWLISAALGLSGLLIFLSTKG